MGQAVVVRYTGRRRGAGDTHREEQTVQSGARIHVLACPQSAHHLTFTSAGVKSFTATYSGDGAFYGISAAVAYTVTGGAGADKVVVFLPLVRR